MLGNDGIIANRDVTIATLVGKLEALKVAVESYKRENAVLLRVIDKMTKATPKGGNDGK